jgi:tetratricopeptide (TPR) repeat protein
VSTWQAVRARQAEQNATKQRNDAQAQRHFARQAADKMFTQVAEKWLARNSSLEPVQKQILLDALHIYEELAGEEGADATLRLETGNAYRRMGEIYDKLGNQPEAERAFLKAHQVLGRLVEEDPFDSDYRSALASAYHRYGFVLHYSARQEEALDAYSQALQLREKLAADFPDVPRYARELAVSLGGVGNMLDNIGSFPKAEAAYLRAIHVMETLPKELADEPDCRFELGLLYSELSGAQEAQGRRQESTPMFYLGKAAYERLVSEFPRDPIYRNELSFALLQEGSRLADRPDDAERGYRRAIAISEQLVRESPTVPDYQYVVGLCYYRLGARLPADRRAEVEEACQQAVRISEQLLADFPEWASSDFGGLFIHGHNALQTLLLENGRPREAEAIYVRALDMNPRLTRDWTKSQTGLWSLAEFRWGLANFARRYARFEESVRLSSEALVLYGQVAAERPDNLAYQQILAARKAELVNFSTHAEPEKDANQ